MNIVEYRPYRKKPDPVTFTVRKAEILPAHQTSFRRYRQGKEESGQG
jgi:hypothetical protein